MAFPPSWEMIIRVYFHGHNHLRERKGEYARIIEWGIPRCNDAGTAVKKEYDASGDDGDNINNEEMRVKLNRIVLILQRHRSEPHIIICQQFNGPSGLGWDGASITYDTHLL